MAYTKNKVYTGINSKGQEYQYEATTHLGVSVDDILELKESLEEVLGFSFASFEECVASGFGKTGLRLGSKEVEPVLYEDADDARKDVSKTFSQLFDEGCAKVGNLYLAYKARDMLSLMTTYYNISKLVAQQLDKYIQTYMLQRMGTREDFGIMLRDNIPYYNNYYTESKDVLDTTTILRKGLEKGLREVRYFHGDTDVLAKKGELENAVKENGLSYDDVLVDLAEAGFIQQYYKDQTEFVFDMQSYVSDYNYGLDLNHRNTISFIGSTSGSTFESDIMDMYNTNNYFEALMLFYRGYLKGAYEAYTYVKKKIASIRKDMIDFDADGICLTGQYQTKSVQTYDILAEIYSKSEGRTISLVEYLSVIKRFCKLDTLQLILNPPYGDKISVSKTKFMYPIA